MILAKQIAVYLNIVHCKFRQYVADILLNEGINITPEQFILIDTLWNEGTMSQQKIADTINKDKNSVTKLVDALEKKGLVVRLPDENDRRSNLIALTPIAESMKLQAKETAINTIDTIIGNIPEEELSLFVEVLKKMQKKMEDYEAK